MLAARLEEVAGRRVRVARLGSGTPVVLLHGYPENLQVWSEVAPLLAARHEVIAFDWPGMGDSEPWPGGATPHAQADRLAKLMDAWGLASAHVAGIDMGGQPALVFASRHAARCRSVAAMNSLVFGDARTSWEIRVLRKFGWNKLVLRFLPRAVFRRAERTFLEPGTRVDPAHRAEFWRCFRRAEVRRFIVRMCAGYQGTLDRLPELYAGIACPALVAWAEGDAHFPVVHAHRLHASMAGSELAIIPGAHHWMPLQRPVELSERLLAFLARTDAGGAPRAT